MAGSGSRVLIDPMLDQFTELKINSENITSIGLTGNGLLLQLMLLVAAQPKERCDSGMKKVGCLWLGTEV